MKFASFRKREDRKASVLLAIVAHVIAIALIASITFRYPIASFFGAHEVMPERIQYVVVQPAPREAAKPAPKKGNEKPKKVAEPPRLVAPVMMPTELPPVTPAAPPVTGSPTGSATGTGGSVNGIATGVEPTLPDPRIELRPNTLRLPLTTAQRNDSAVKAIYLAYRQAEIEAEAHQGRNPRDWTFEKGGGKYGVDSSYIYLGKFKLPSAILAALPFNYGGVDGRRIIDGRNADWIRQDIYEHSQGLSEEDFRTAIKRIRERKEREKKEADEAKGRGSVVP